MSEEAARVAAIATIPFPGDAPKPESREFIQHVRKSSWAFVRESKGMTKEEDLLPLASVVVEDWFHAAVYHDEPYYQAVFHAVLVNSGAVIGPSPFPHHRRMKKSRTGYPDIERPPLHDNVWGVGDASWKLQYPELYNRKGEERPLW